GWLARGAWRFGPRLYDGGALVSGAARAAGGAAPRALPYRAPGPRRHRLRSRSSVGRLSTLSHRALGDTGVAAVTRAPREHLVAPSASHPRCVRGPRLRRTPLLVPRQACWPRHAGLNTGSNLNEIRTRVEVAARGA